MAFSHEQIPEDARGAGDAVMLRGYVLRAWLLSTLRDSGQVMTVADLVACLERDGFRTPGRPSKDVSDALRWEVGRGRARRVGRSRYQLGYLPRETASRMRRRLRDLTNSDVGGAAGRDRAWPAIPDPRDRR